MVGGGGVIEVVVVCCGCLVSGLVEVTVRGRNSLDSSKDMFDLFLIFLTDVMYDLS